MPKDRRKDRHSPGYMQEFKAENYVQVNVRIRKDSGIIEALEMAHRLTGIPKSEYIRDAVSEKLQADGYMPEK